MDKILSLVSVTMLVPGCARNVNAETRWKFAKRESFRVTLNVVAGLALYIVQRFRCNKLAHQLTQTKRLSFIFGQRQRNTIEFIITHNRLMVASAAQHLTA
jgi:hypothetical protein